MVDMDHAKNTYVGTTPATGANLESPTKAGKTFHPHWNPDVAKLFETVVEGGYCVGCGACASVANSPIQMRLNKYGQFCATIEPSANQSALKSSVMAVCPFSGVGPNEDIIGQQIFGKNCNYHDKLGYILATYAGSVVEGHYREISSSGGMATWILAELLNSGLVDGVIHVQPQHPSSSDPLLFRYRVSTTLEQVRKGAKSRYYPVEMSEVMRSVREKPGRYAIVGVPSFVKAVRLLMGQDPVLAERIRFCISIFCGHLKSTRFAEMFAWQLGLKPENLLEIDFRKKYANRPAGIYGVEVGGLVEGSFVRRDAPAHEIDPDPWGKGLFKYRACDYCDDVVGETADISLGDAWIPRYVKDSRGTSVIIVRHSGLHDLILQAMAEGRLRLDRIDPEEIAQSQAGGFRHRRDGLAYRLHLADRQGEWRPPKRVVPNADHLSGRRKKIYEMRMAIASESHVAFREALDAGDYSRFTQRMAPLVRQYLGPRWTHVVRRGLRLLNALGISTEPVVKLFYRLTRITRV